MGKAIAYEYRKKICECYASGLSQKRISEDFGYSLSGIKKILRLHRKNGESAFETRYANCGSNSPKIFSPRIEKEIAERRTKSGGSYYVYCVLKENCYSEKIPSRRTIQRRWARFGNPRTKKEKHEKTNKWTKEVHHTWQIDGKEQVKLEGGEEMSWMNIGDEASGTALQTEVFPPEADERNI